MRVDVVIPAHGKWHLTQRCLDSLRQRDACVREVIVVDDASPDETAQRLRARSDVRPVALERNGGFSAACNAGAARADAGAILFLNNDTIVPPGAIERLAAALAADASLGAVGAKLTYADGTIQSAACTFMKHLDTWRLYQHLDATLPQANVAVDCAYVTGAALLVRTELFRALGGFDEGYRNGVEDVDLCLNIWRSGHRVRYVPQAEILHLEGASRGRSDDANVNWRHFAARWSNDVLASLPRFRPVEAPHFIVHWRDRAPIDALVREHLARTFRTHGSVRATFASRPGAAAIERGRSAVERRGVMTIGYGGAKRTDARWVFDASGAGRDEAIWVPTQRMREALVNAGADAARVTVVRLGFFSDASIRTDAPTVVVTDASVPAWRLAAIVRAMAPGAPIVFDLDAFDAAALRALREAPLVVFAGYGDAWGFIGGERLAAGATIVAPRGAVFLEIMPDDVALTCELDVLPDAAAELRRNPGSYAHLGAAARRESALRSPAVYCAERIQELGRARAGGIVDPHAVAIDAAIAKRLAAK